jgi:soluble lytic murein transglycosylase
MAYVAHRYAEAVTYLHQLSTAYPDALYRDNALFWLGKAQEKQQKKGEAIAIYRLLALHYPFTYHGHRAAVHLQRLAPKEKSPSLNASLGSADHALQLSKTALSEEMRFHLERVEELSALRFFEDSHAEILVLISLFPEGAAYKFLLGQLYFQAGFYLESIRISNAVLRDIPLEKRLRLPRDFWHLLFPRLYWSQIQAAGAEHNIDPYLILAVIRQESAFQRYALSRSNAHGLMQLIPSTGRSLYQDLKGGSLGNDDQLFEPALNIALGTLYLKQLLKRYDGNLILALASYNAGMGRVRQWRQQISEHDWDEFIEDIPFTETRGYVKSVLRNYHVYQKLYGGSAERKG